MRIIKLYVKACAFYLYLTKSLAYDKMLAGKCLNVSLYKADLLDKMSKMLYNIGKLMQLNCNFSISLTNIHL